MFNTTQSSEISTEIDLTICYLRENVCMLLNQESSRGFTYLNLVPSTSYLNTGIVEKVILLPTRR